jgi:ABC-type transporter Mla MlaB component
VPGVATVPVGVGWPDRHRAKVSRVHLDEYDDHGSGWDGARLVRYTTSLRADGRAGVCLTLRGSNVAMSAGRDVVTGDLGFDARAEFIAAARAAITSADTDVELDCSAVETVDDAVIGMLVSLARAAQRRGARVALIRAPKPSRQPSWPTRRALIARLVRC